MKERIPANRPNRINKVILSTVLALLAWPACRADKKQQDPTPAPVSPSTVTVTDSLGRKTAVPVPVRRVACLYAFTGHVVAVLGKAETVVAVSNGLKRAVLLNAIFPAFGRARVPKAQGALNVEELLNTRPDLAFISGDIGEREGELKKLDQFHIPYLVIDFQTVARQQQAIAAIGRALGAERAAAEYNRYSTEVLDRLAARTADLGADARVRLYQATTDPTRTVGGASLSVQWMEHIGIKNVAAGLPPGRENHVGIEQLYLWNPDVIVTNEPGVAEAMRANPQWANLKALRQGRVFQMPIGLSRWGHPGSLETPLAALWLARTVYPERFAEVDIAKEMRAFYQRFFHYELSDELVSRILAGEGMRLTRDHQKAEGSEPGPAADQSSGAHQGAGRGRRREQR